jgi:hypothetical protein
MGKTEEELYQEYLESTTPEQRAKLAKEGLDMKPPGERTNKRNLSEIERQAIRVNRLMDRIDVPFDLPEDREDVYAVPFHKRHIQGILPLI